MPLTSAQPRAQQSFLLALVASVALAGCATPVTPVTPVTPAPPATPEAPEAPVVLIPPNLTFSFTQFLPVGTTLSFTSVNIEPMELLLLQRCGSGCNTAKVVGQWRKSDFDRLSEQAVVLTESGEYYFWIKKELANGEIGPVPGQTAVFKSTSGVAQFTSGTSVSVVIRPPAL